MHIDHLVKNVIEPTLKHLERYDKGMNTPAATELLTGIAAQESHGGKYLRQMKTGPALGIYQIEPVTHRDIWERYLSQKSHLTQITLQLASRQEGLINRERDLVMNLAYQTAIARIYLWTFHEPLPPPGDVWGQAAYWKKYWNTKLGAGVAEDYVTNFERYQDNKTL